ncbi:hypothetical protein KPH14_002896 [Odynerus spinipes]|uniref:Histidine decarboxylase n=2 Tax=Apocrita TaxID=7400 RepID=A0AAD9RX73_9HYME|nr:hypothetical protein KPH14_002896 [Odynerus spinipes]
MSQGPQQLHPENFIASPSPLHPSNMDRNPTSSSHSRHCYDRLKSRYEPQSIPSSPPPDFGFDIHGQSFGYCPWLCPRTLRHSMPDRTHSISLKGRFIEERATKTPPETLLPEFIADQQRSNLGALPACINVGLPFYLPSVTGWLDPQKWFESELSGSCRISCIDEFPYLPLASSGGSRRGTDAFCKAEPEATSSEGRAWKEGFRSTSESPKTRVTMNLEEYRKHGKEMVDYIADYLENIRSRRVYPAVSPGYLKNVLPPSAPVDGETWDDIFADVERCIMPGVTHWQSPHMHAYFPALNSPASLLGDMLADAINCLGFTWASSPACTELEMIVMNWLGKMLGLPEEFLHRPGVNGGGGVIQTTASEATLVALLAARTRAIRDVQESEPDQTPAEINSRLVAYCSDQAHSSVEKAGLIGLVKMRYIESDADLSMRGEALEEALARDRADGLLPFFVCATLGTTGACSFDNLKEVGPICERNGLWLHIDAAYAGSAFICPEFRGWLQGVEYANSFAFNPSKWLMVHFDCTAMWVKNSQTLHRTFNVDPLYLKHENSGLAIDYMHWQIPLSKRFRALKLWFVIRNYGISGLQKHIREGIRLAQKFEALVLADPRFEMPAPRHLGMVVFRLRGENSWTERLLKKMNSRGRVHCVPAALHGKYVIRFSVTSTNTTNEDILKDWAEIRNTANEILGDNSGSPVRARVPLADTREKNENFGSSLLLANSPMSPKIVNGSFAAIYDATDVFEECMKNFGQLRVEAKDSPAMRRRIRGILMSGKQFSLDSRMDLVQGYVCCGRLAEPPTDLPQMKEDEDGLATIESTLSIDKTDSTYNDISRENSMVRSDSDESFDKNAIAKEEMTKARSGYGITNGSVVKQENEGQEASSVATGEKGIPRSETIGAIGHRPYTGELVPPRLRSDRSIKDKEEIHRDDKDDDDGEKDDDGKLCRKCGHSLKRQ